MTIRIAWVKSSTAFPLKGFLFPLPFLGAGAKVTNNSENNRSWSKLVADMAKGRSHPAQEGKTPADRCPVCLCLPLRLRSINCTSVQLERSGFA